MARPEVRVLVLYEDAAHESFMRRLVERLKLKPVRFVNGRNCHGVLGSLGKELDALRAKKHQKNLGFIVMIDADDGGLSGRTREVLERIAADTKEGARTESERIALLVPTRAIETWYVHFCCPTARPVNEEDNRKETDYKKSAEWKELSKDLGVAAKRTVEAWEPERGRVDPASVQAARQELARLQ